MGEDKETTRVADEIKSDRSVRRTMSGRCSVIRLFFAWYTNRASSDRTVRVRPILSPCFLHPATAAEQRSPSAKYNISP